VRGGRKVVAVEEGQVECVVIVGPWVGVSLFPPERAENSVESHRCVRPAARRNQGLESVKEGQEGTVDRLMRGHFHTETRD